MTCINLCTPDSDLQGYFSDGFIRPDEEIVYTTSASDGSVENDIDNLRNPIPVLRQDSQEQPDLDTNRHRFQHAQTSNRNVECDGHSFGETEHNMPSSRSNHACSASCDNNGHTRSADDFDEGSPRQMSLKNKKKNKLSSELEKELASLQPFYYDK